MELIFLVFLFLFFFPQRTNAGDVCGTLWNDYYYNPFPFDTDGLLLPALDDSALFRWEFKISQVAYYGRRTLSIKLLVNVRR